MSKQKPIVKQNEENEVSFEMLAQSIVEIGSAMKKLNASRLNRKALILLVSKSSGQSQTATERVLDSLDQLEATYLKKKVR